MALKVTAWEQAAAKASPDGGSDGDPEASEDGSSGVSTDPSSLPPPLVVERPPLNGTRDAWQAYAESLGYIIDPDDTRADIIAIVDLP